MVLIAGVDEDDNVILIEADALVKALVTITTPHHMIHVGKSFTVSHWFDNIEAVGSAMLRILVGDDKELHATVSVSAEATGRFQIMEGATYQGDGTVITIFDKNRKTANTSNAIAAHTPIVDVAGTIIYDSYIPGGTKQRSIGSVRTNGEEWILKKSEDYLFTYINLGGADKDASIEVEFYEV